MSFAVLKIETPWRTMYKVTIDTRQTMRPVYRRIMNDHQEPFDIMCRVRVLDTEGHPRLLERALHESTPIDKLIKRQDPGEILLWAQYKNKTYDNACRLKAAIKERAKVKGELQEVVPLPDELIKEVMKFLPYELSRISRVKEFSIQADSQRKRMRRST